MSEMCKRRSYHVQEHLKWSTCTYRNLGPCAAQHQSRWHLPADEVVAQWQRHILVVPVLMRLVLGSDMMCMIPRALLHTGKP
jgi:hypothetical protein